MYRRLWRQCNLKAPMVCLAILIAMHIDAQAQVRISQIYGGGGNAGSTLKNDFIELFNAAAESVGISGWSVQYASSAGAAWQKTDLLGFMGPQSWFLIQEGQGAGGTEPLPAPDVIGTIGMSATAGKVALVLNGNLLSGGHPGGDSIVDMVGFGPGASCYEGPAPAPSPGNSTAILRKGEGMVDGDDNRSDFEVGPPQPRNRACAPLPAHLVRFVAEAAEGHRTIVSWSTDSEIGSYGFFVERRDKGEEGFVELPRSFRQGCGTTTDRHEYQFTDEDSPAVPCEYRLREVSLAGTASFSQSIAVMPVTSVTGEVAATLRLMQNYPNPFNPSTTLEFTVSRTERVSLRVFSILGQEVALLFDGTAEAGRRHLARFDARMLPAGVYFARLESGGRSLMVTMLVIR